jgi:predicted O-linked N-acetylglucosamine transferase (SPINDLY family)
MATISEILANAVRLHEAGQLQAAERVYRRVLALEPKQADAWHLLGVVAYQVGKYALAVEYIGRAIGLKGTEAAFHSNLGNALRAAGKLDEAVACYRRALELKPDYAQALNNLGIALNDQGKPDEGAACFRRASELKPDFAEAHNNLGNAFLDQMKLDEAVACYRRALELKPDYAEAHHNLGIACKDQGKLDEALACYRRALKLQPDDATVHSSLACTLNFCPGQNARTIYEEHRRWNQQHAEPLAKFIRPHANDRTADRRLRVAYVSPDFRWHPVGRFLLPLLQSHDHREFEIFCYACQNSSDFITARCQAHADVWRNVADCADEQLATTVREDHIDILVDLSMHMAKNRLLVFARKPAPVQVAYLAYAGTTGLRMMDYRLTDPYLDSPEERPEFYGEQSVCLPETYWCYLAVREAPAVDRLPALRTGHVTFGCLNNFCKVTAPTLAAWSHLLQAVPASRLILHAHAGSHRDRVLEFFAQDGVPPERVTFVPMLAPADYFRKYEQIDVALDPFPYNGGTTTCDALWMGVPVVSLAGQTAVGRGGFSILSNLGLTELVAHDSGQYVGIAAELAGNLSRLGGLRQTLRERMQMSPLMDAPRFARNVETAYRTMWRRWCSLGLRRAPPSENFPAESHQPHGQE